MLSSSDEQIVRIFKRRLEAITTVKQIRVFGSRARGDASDDSDLDLFIELAELTPPLRNQIREIAWEVSLAEGVVISTFVATTQGMVDSPLAANPILKVIQTEGIAV